MTRIDSVRHAADVTKDSVRHAAEVAAPYAKTAREGAVVYGRQAGLMTRQQYEARLADRVLRAREQALAAVPPKAVTAAGTAARRTRDGAKAAADYTVPKVGTAVAATLAVAVPARDEALLRGGAALQALRGQVSASDIERLVRKRIRRQRNGRAFRRLVITALAGGAAVAALKWWSRQSNPDWLVEPTEPTEPTEVTEVTDRATPVGGTLTVVDPLDDSTASLNGSAPRVDSSPDASGLDPETEAEQAEADNRRNEKDDE